MVQKKQIKKIANLAVQQNSKMQIAQKYDYFVLFATLVFAIILIFNLFCPPLGMKTSTDFGRIMDLFHLYYQPGEMNWDSFHSVFNTNRPDNMSYNGYMTTTSILLAISFIPNYIVRLFIDNGNDLYFIACLGVVYSIIYIFAFYVFMGLIRQRTTKLWLFTLIAIFTIWGLTDILVTEYFNTFFQEPAFIVCFLLFITCFIRYNSFVVDLILLTLVLFSKEQNLIFLLLIIPIFLKHKVNTIRLISTIILFTGILLIYNNTNSYLKVMNTEDGVLSGLLHNKTDNEAKQILTRIGLNPDMSVLANSDYWGNVSKLRNNPNDINLQQQFEDAATTISKKNTILGYIYFPSIFFSNYAEYIKITTKDGPFVGNYSYNDNGVLIANYSTYFAKIIIKHLGLLLIINLCVVFLGITQYFFKKKLLLLIKKDNGHIKSMLNNKINNEYTLLFTLNAVLLLVIPVNFMGAGYAEVVKHCLELYFAEAINLLLIITVILGYKR